MTIIRKIPWTERPPEGTGLNRASSLANDLIGFWPCNDNGPLLKDISDSGNHAKQNIAIDHNPAVGSGSMAPDFDSSTSQYFEVTDSTRYRFFGEFSFSCRVKFSNVGSGWQGIFTHSRDAPQFWGFWLNNGGTLGGSTGSSGIGAFTPSVDTWYHLHFVEGSSNRWFYVDGVQIATASRNAASNGSGNTVIGAAKNGTEYLDDAQVTDCKIWNRRISVTEVVNDANNPWDIYQPRTQIIPTFVASSGDVDIAAVFTATLSVAADLNAAGALASAQSFALTVAADLDAQGKLEAAASLVLSVAAELKAAGDLQAANTLQLSLLADIDALGALNAAANLALTVAIDLDAQGKLEAAYAIALTVTAAVTGTALNDMAAAPALALTLSPDIDAPGRLAAANSLSLSLSADLGAGGDIAAPLSISVSALADLDAAGQVAAVMPIALSVAADPSAPGSLAAAASIVLSVSAGLTDANSVDVSVAVRILAEARNRPLIAQDRDRVITAATRRRHINVNKLH